MDTNSLIGLFKSIRNSFVGSDSSSYFTLGSTAEAKNNHTMTNNHSNGGADRNNNTTTTTLMSVESAAADRTTPNGTLARKGSFSSVSSRQSTTEPDDDDSRTADDVQHTECVVDQRIPSPTASDHSDSGRVSGDSSEASEAVAECAASKCDPQVIVNNTVPCCDIMKYKNELCEDLQQQQQSSLVNHQIKFGQKVAASKLIQVMIDAVNSGQLLASLEPFHINTSQNFSISPLVTVCMQNCEITGFSNVEKAETDGYIRCVDKNRFSIDFVIQLVDLRCVANYNLKLGQKWHKRVCLRNKTFTLKLDKCLIYVELKINTKTKNIRVERFSMISQQNVRCKSTPFQVNSINHRFCKLLQTHFKRLLAANVFKLEREARRYLDRTALLKYDGIFGETGLQKLLQCFATSSTGTDASNGQSANDTSNS